MNSDSILYVLTGIAIMFATMCTLYFTIKRQDRIWQRDWDKTDGDGTLRV
jgi:hypothetical protein